MLTLHWPGWQPHEFNGWEVDSFPRQLPSNHFPNVRSHPPSKLFPFEPDSLPLHLRCPLATIKVICSPGSLCLVLSHKLVALSLTEAIKASAAQGKEETQLGYTEGFYTSNWSWLWGDDNHTWVGLSHAKAGWRPPHKYWQTPFEWLSVRSGTRPTVPSAGKSKMLFAPLTMRIREGLTSRKKCLKTKSRVWGGVSSKRPRTRELIFDLGKKWKNARIRREKRITHPDSGEDKARRSAQVSWIQTTTVKAFTSVTVCLGS